MLRDDIRATSTVWLWPPQQEGPVVSLAAALWPSSECLHINGPDRMHEGTAGPAFMLAAFLAYFPQTFLYGCPSLFPEYQKQVEMEQLLIISKLITIWL